jgi:hypothetical protein
MEKPRATAGVALVVRGFGAGRGRRVETGNEVVAGCGLVIGG